eukprot:c8487_g1_i1.p1 GENE.c8487_g1_i1~~c8487_g1_i1.p1  ORF type:complete len:434 (-),score=72.32 c8487_g1_i1:83-1342(-)
MGHEGLDDNSSNNGSISAETVSSTNTMPSQQMFMGGNLSQFHQHLHHFGGPPNSNNGSGAPGNVLNGVLHNSSGVPLGNGLMMGNGNNSGGGGTEGATMAATFDMGQSHARHRRSHSDSVKFLASAEGFRLIIPPATLDTLRNIDSDNQSVTVILAPEPSSNSLVGPDGSPRFRGDPNNMNNKSSTRPKHYKCSKCGQPKKGHVCEFSSDSKPPRAPNKSQGSPHISPNHSALLPNSQGVRSVGQRTGTSPRDLNSGVPFMHLHQPLQLPGSTASGMNTNTPQDAINMARNYLQHQLSQSFPQDLSALMLGANTSGSGMMNLDHLGGSSNNPSASSMMMPSMAHNNNSLPVFPQDPPPELNLTMSLRESDDEVDEGLTGSIFEAMHQRLGRASGDIIKDEPSDFSVFLSQENMDDLDDQ